jgi:hypothetical protein
MKLYENANFFLDYARLIKNAVSYTHTGPKVVLTGFETFRSENEEKSK